MSLGSYVGNSKSVIMNRLVELPTPSYLGLVKLTTI
ncbi:hypothetical protein MY3296_006504 [Beauveria thailandica]